MNKNKHVDWKKHKALRKADLKKITRDSPQGNLYDKQNMVKNHSKTLLLKIELIFTPHVLRYKFDGPTNLLKLDAIT